VKGRENDGSGNPARRRCNAEHDPCSHRSPEAGLDELRHGGSPTITKGPHAGEGIALDHVLPRSILPELAAKLFNLGAITAKDNRAKSAKITAGELKLARQWNREGLLSNEGLAAVVAASK
jgi:hypothetical protein